MNGYELIPVLINFGFFVILLALGLFVGKTTEIRHLHRLDRREHESADILMTDLRTFPGLLPSGPQGILVTGEAVIATDYLKSFLARLKKIVGGEIRSFETLVMRARREAILRMKDQARELGFNAVCNIRLETADIGGNATSRGVAIVAVLASGTAYRVADRDFEA